MLENIYNLILVPHDKKKTFKGYWSCKCNTFFFKQEWWRVFCNKQSGNITLDACFCCFESIFTWDAGFAEPLLKTSVQCYSTLFQIFIFQKYLFINTFFPQNTRVAFFFFFLQPTEYITAFQPIIILVIKVNSWLIFMTAGLPRLRSGLYY